ncbi:MAG: hypothetical protein M0036_12680 [Desulfobacteraceae bacterium]|nr:hypothetical protein [Desulfobacteraceae bacterium]
MALVIGAIFISLSVFAYCIVLLAFRNPQQPSWASDNWIGNCHSIIILSLGLGGVLTWCSIIFRSLGNTISSMHIIVTACILVATFIGVKAMRIGKKLAEYERQTGPRPTANRSQTVGLTPSSSKIPA